ncbi:MAG: hypothetical protein O2931_01720 [Planctomycetota bacterium]|nr:hypothetical protein [Planctomycetota bacterium]MDA1177491.1 hypothetical protein [Planctomycetota bacterium]
MVESTCRIFVSVAATCSLFTALVSAQPDGDRGRFGRGFTPSGGGAMGIIMQDQVRQELQLTEDQVGKIEELLRSTADSARKRFGNFRDLSGEEREAAVEKMRQDREKIEKDLTEQLRGVLNSDQATRYAELEFQFLLQQGDLVRALKKAGVEVETDKADALRIKQEEVMKRVHAEIAKIRDAGNREILSDAVSESQLQKLMGEPFAFEMGPPRRGRERSGPEDGKRRRGDQPESAAPEDNDDDGPPKPRRRRDL